MPRAYSEDLRVRVIAAVMAGQSARQAARVFRVSPSAAIKWLQRWRRTGSAAARPMGGGRRTSPLDREAEYLLALAADAPDLTLEEIRCRLAARDVRVGIGSVWRFFDRHGISFKKNRARRRAGSSGRRRPAAAMAGRSAVF